MPSAKYQSFCLGVNELRGEGRHFAIRLKAIQSRLGHNRPITGRHWKRYTVQLVTLRPRQNGRHFADKRFQMFPWMKIYGFRLNFAEVCPKGPMNNIPALIQLMVWRRPGDKPLSESMMVSLLTHICVTRPQWVIWGSVLTWWFSLKRLLTCDHSMFTLAK